MPERIDATVLEQQPRAPVVSTGTRQHVAIDCRMAWAAGIGRFIRNVVPRLARLEPDWRFTLIGDAPRMLTASWALGGPSSTTGPQNVRVAQCSAPIYGVREQLELPWRTPSDARVFWAPHYNAPVLCRSRLVVTVHDVAHLRLPHFRRNVLRRTYASTMFGSVVRRADAVMCVSQFTLSELRELFGPPRGTAAVVHNGVDESWFSGNAGRAPLPRPYFVFVGDQKPHKNLPTLLNAFASLQRREEVMLALIGRRSEYRQRDDSIEPLLRSLGDRVVVTGELDEQILQGFVRHAVALVQPSLYEGFGLPPLEAMASGCPVIASRAASLPEVCGDAALYFDPQDSSALETHMRTLLHDESLRADLIARGKRQAGLFDWSRTAAQVRDILASVA